MIKIVIKRDESSQKITSIEVKGHSGKDVKGKDLVCAAISAIIIIIGALLFFCLFLASGDVLPIEITCF